VVNSLILKLLVQQLHSAEKEHTRPSIVATLLWAFAIVIIGFTVYSMVSWQGWTQDIHDTLLVLVAFSSGTNAIATGALIDMHTMRFKRKGKEYG
jgi:ABC-type uncharacterized transport system permease subunit